MADTLSAIRERLHRKSHEYFVFDQSRRTRESWSMFYGATDALLDAGTAAASYRRAISSDTGVNLIACYGFLQALYVQQDAVRTLCRAVGLKWHPNSNERLKEIREIRNRLTGHPALAGEQTEPRRLSSAIISYNDIGPERFRGCVYYDDGAEIIEVDVSTVLEDNERQLVAQMFVVENEMDKEESRFRSEQSEHPFALCFDARFNYLLQRLSCDLSDEGRVGQARSHAQMIHDTMVTLRDALVERGFQTTATSLYLDRIFTGLGLLEGILGRASTKRDDQLEFDLIYGGIEKNVDRLQDLVCAIDSGLHAPVLSLQAAGKVGTAAGR
jgi:hypothetical protein